jgi:hypothetical protein
VADSNVPDQIAVPEPNVAQKAKAWKKKQRTRELVLFLVVSVPLAALAGWSVVARLIDAHQLSTQGRLVSGTIVDGKVKKSGKRGSRYSWYVTIQYDDTRKSFICSRMDGDYPLSRSSVRNIGGRVPILYLPDRPLVAMIAPEDKSTLSILRREEVWFGLLGRFIGFVFLTIIAVGSVIELRELRIGSGKAI